MERVIFYSQSLNPELVRDALAKLEIHLVGSRRELAEAVVHEPDVLCVLIQVEDLDREFENLLTSLRRSMPRLHVGVICGTCREALPEVYTHIPQSDSAGTLIQDIQNYVFTTAVTNRRKANRFDWPLQAYFSIDEKAWEEFRVRSLSCGGAFLETESPGPEPGTRGKLRIVFRDFKMLTACEVLDRRYSSSNLPAGFGVRFLGFSDASCHVIDRIVGDALVRSLIDPDRDTGTPTLGAESVLSIGPELT